MSLRNSSIYVYSFLDVRENLFGSATLADLDSELANSLHAYGVNTRVLRFKNSAPGSSFAFSEYRPIYGRTNGSTAVPVRETISSNLSNEANFHSDYRLIIFPSDFQSAGAHQWYSIRWTLVDVRSGREVWSATSRGHRMIWANQNERAEERAKVIVDGLIEQLKAGSML